MNTTFKRKLGQLARSVSNVPGTMPFVVWVEDKLAWWRVCGTQSRRRMFSEQMERCETTRDWLALSGRHFSMTQIDEEITRLIDMLAEQEVKTVVEIGTAQGGTSFLLMHAVSGVEFFLGLDLHVRHRSLLKGMAPEGAAFHAVDGSSYDEGTLAKVKSLLDGREIDFLLIDGDHRYEGVRADYLAYKSMVREGGLIAFHDIVPSQREDYRVIDERWSGGVPRYWEELKTTEDEVWEIVADSGQGGFGLGVLRKSPRD